MWRVPHPKQDRIAGTATATSRSRRTTEFSDLGTEEGNAAPQAAQSGLNGLCAMKRGRRFLIFVAG